MRDPGPETPATETALLRSMVLLSTLHTAAEVWHDVAEHRAGRDPSGQETVDVARPFVIAARAELETLLMRLHSSLAYRLSHDEDAVPALVRRFDDALLLRRVGRLLHVMHQRMLSLYPLVPEDLVEAVRLLEAHQAQLAEADEEALDDATMAFLNEGLRFATALRRTLG